MGRIKELIVFHNTLIKKEKYYFVFRKKKIMMLFSFHAYGVVGVV